MMAIHIKKYFMWSGLVLVILTVLVTGLSGLYSDYYSCLLFQQANAGNMKILPTPGTSIIGNPAEYMGYLEARLLCSSVNNNIFMSYLAIIIGLSLVIGGYITQE